MEKEIEKKDIEIKSMEQKFELKKEEKKLKNLGNLKFSEMISMSLKCYLIALKKK